MTRGSLGAVTSCLISVLFATAVPARAADTDGDGLTDLQETTGWEILVDEHGWNDARLVAHRTVFSDPGLADTDGDGLDDLTEYLIGSDPSRADSDADGLDDAEEWNRWMTSPVAADSDGDSRGPDHDLPPSPTLFDGFELSIVGTSPTLDDTDGDGRSDLEEYDDPLYSPLVAELPEYKVTLVGPADVRLRVQYAESVGQESQYGTSMTMSQTTSESRGGSDTASFETGLSVMVGGSYGFPSSSVTAEVTASYKFGMSATASWTSSSSQTAQKESSRFLTDSLTKTETAASGSISIGVVVENTGLTTFEISTLGLAARQWQPAFDPVTGALDPQASRFKTVATLLPDLSGITLAPFTSSPELRVAAEEVDPTLIKEFLAHPTSLQFGTVALEILDENGINFDFLIQKTLPRTALVVIDFGDGRLERYRVATNVDRSLDGEFLGVTMARALHILGIPYETRLAGTDRVLSSVRSTAEALPYTGWSTFLELFGNAYGAPMELILRSPPESIYGTFTACRNLAARDVAVVSPGATFRAGRSIVLENGFSVASDAELTGLVDPTLDVDLSDFEAIPLHAADTMTLAFNRDEDQDGLVNYVEELYGTLDASGNTDTDGDGIDDATEVREGWLVEVRDSAGTVVGTRQVFSDPRSADTDGDGVDDGTERLLGTDPNNPDSDGDSRGDAYEYALSPLAPLRIAPRFYVDASSAASVPDGLTWATAYPEFQTALDFALLRLVDGDVFNDVSEIWVARGVYRPDPVPLDCDPLPCVCLSSPDPDLFFYLVDHVPVYGGFVGGEDKRDQRNPDPMTNATVLSGDLCQDDSPDLPDVLNDPDPCATDDSWCENSWTLVKHVNAYPETTETSLDGFTLTGGGFKLAGGGGLDPDYSTLQLSSTHASLRNLLIWRNAGYAGNLAYGRHDMVNVMAVGNTSGPHLWYTTGTIVDSVFSANSDVGLLWLAWPAVSAGGDLLVQGATFERNQDVGLSIVTYGSEIGPRAVVRNSRFLHNSGLGAMRAMNTPTFISQSLFWDNESSWAGALSCGATSSEVHVVNSTFVGNRATDPSPEGDEAGAVSCPPARIRNSIFVDNSVVNGGTGDDREQVWGDATNRLQLLRSSCVQGLSFYAGADNVPAGDLSEFQDGAHGNLRLSGSSSCIDVGDPFVDWDPWAVGLQPPPWGDIEGLPRVVDGDGDGQAVIDTGAHEYQP